MDQVSENFKGVDVGALQFTNDLTPGLDIYLDFRDRSRQSFFAGFRIWADL